MGVGGWNGKVGPGGTISGAGSSRNRSDAGRRRRRPEQLRLTACGRRSPGTDLAPDGKGHRRWHPRGQRGGRGPGRPPGGVTPTGRPLRRGDQSGRRRVAAAQRGPGHGGSTTARRRRCSAGGAGRRTGRSRRPGTARTDGPAPRRRPVRTRQVRSPGDHRGLSRPPAVPGAARDGARRRPRRCVVDRSERSGHRGDRRGRDRQRRRRRPARARPSGRPAPCGSGSAFPTRSRQRRWSMPQCVPTSLSCSPHPGPTRQERQTPGGRHERRGAVRPRRGRPAEGTVDLRPRSMGHQRRSTHRLRQVHDLRRGTRSARLRPPRVRPAARRPGAGHRQGPDRHRSLARRHPPWW